MSAYLLNIGYNNYVSTLKIVSVVGVESAPVKRLISEARRKGILVDATSGHKTRSVIVTKEHIILSAVLPDSIAERLNKGNK